MGQFVGLKVVILRVRGPFREGGWAARATVAVVKSIFKRVLAQ